MLEEPPLVPHHEQGDGREARVAEISITIRPRTIDPPSPRAITLDNLRKFTKGGYVEGVTYRPLTSKKRGELGTVVQKGGTHILQTMDEQQHLSNWRRWPAGSRR